MGLSAGIPRPARGQPAALRLSHAPDGAAGRVELALVPDGPLADGARMPAELRAGCAFLLDAAGDALAPEGLARLLGTFFFASAAARGHATVRVALHPAGAPSAGVTVPRPAVEVERTVFGAAHVLHEDAALGLYVLEIAPGATIPAHYHRVMQESELVLDPGLLLQGRPVRPGAAFRWPAGHIHEYRNPGAAPARVLCLDRPRFIPEDEIEVWGAELLPARPWRHYPL